MSQSIFKPDNTSHCFVLIATTLYSPIQKYSDNQKATENENKNSKFHTVM
jgi:hypothetical protein